MRSTTHWTLAGLLAAVLTATSSAQTPFADGIAAYTGPLRHLRLNLATGELSEQPPSSNGPDAPVKSFSNTNLAGLLTTITPPRELVDFGVKSTGLTGIVSVLGIAYATKLLDPSVGGPGATLTIRLYQGTQGFCASTPTEPGVLIATFDIPGLPGTFAAGTFTGFLVELDLGATSILVPDGPLGWSYQTQDPAGSTGPLLVFAGGPTGTIDAFDIYSASPAGPATCLGTFNFGAANPNIGSFYLELTEDDGATSGSAVIDNGSGTNPSDYFGTSFPMIGGSFNSTIQPNPMTPVTIVALAGASDPGSPNPFGSGELLVSPAPFFPILDVAVGMHSIPIPLSANLIGVKVFTQGFRVEPDANGNLTAAALNALKLTIGT